VGSTISSEPFSISKGKSTNRSRNRWLEVLATQAGETMASQLAMPTSVVAALSRAETPVQIAAILLNRAET
jgi:hypothetical protein